MPYIPHTESEIKTMLSAIGVASIDALFDEIPASLRHNIDAIPAPLTELEINQLMQERANQDDGQLSFIGAGAYDHHIPAAVWKIAARGEFYSAYTPYQAEASQGTLQVIYEYQSMIAELTALDVSNASLYDGSSGLAEAILMAVRCNRKKTNNKILIAKTLHPSYQKVIKTITEKQKITYDVLDYLPETGLIDLDNLPSNPDHTALVISFPNFFGTLDDVDILTNWAHQHDMLVIAHVNPTALGLLKAPGHWGTNGADIAVGEGQPLGIPLSSGGPYFGFLCCKSRYIHKMPGRIVGQTLDIDGKTGYTLTLQAREQHIRRSKATSNICTNQGLMVTAATIYMALMGYRGLQSVAKACHYNTHLLSDKLTAIEGVTEKFSGPYFHETIIQFNRPIAAINLAMTEHNIAFGYPLQQDYPELTNCLLICATEKRTITDIEKYVGLINQLFN